jgi:hypothetical protein
VPGRHIGIGTPAKLLAVETLFAGATIFAVREGAVKPAKVRVRTMARTKVVFIGSPGQINW